MFVEALRSGRAEAVATLAMLGQSHRVSLDYVESHQDHYSAKTLSATHTVWYWLHCAPEAAGVVACWETWVNRELTAATPRQRSTLIDGLLGEALDATLSARVAPAGLLESAERLLGWAPECDGRWGHENFTNTIAQHAVRHGEHSIAVLEALRDRGLLVRGNIARWCSEKDGLLTQALDRGFPKLAAFLLEAWVEPDPKVLVRQQRVLAKALVDAVRQGPGVWAMDRLGERLLDCAQVLRNAGAPDLDFSGHEHELLELVNPDEGWLQADAARVRSLVLQGQLTPAPAAPSRPRF